MAFRTKKTDLANLAREWAQESGLDAQTRVRFRALADEIEHLTPPTTETTERTTTNGND